MEVVRRLMLGMVMEVSVTLRRRLVETEIEIVVGMEGNDKLVKLAEIDIVVWTEGNVMLPRSVDIDIEIVVGIEGVVETDENDRLIAEVILVGIEDNGMLDMESVSPAWL